MADFTHVDERGAARLVDVGAKAVTKRRAVARGWIRMQAATAVRIRDGAVAKGDVLQVARVAGIMGAKKAGELIPLCHPLGLDAVRVDLTLAGEDRIMIEAEVSTEGKTGVEMEALAAVSVAALTLYDMCKAVDKTMVIEGIHLAHKSGGRSGDFAHPAPPR